VQRTYLREWLYHRCIELLAQDVSADSRFEALRVDLQAVHLRSNNPGSATKTADEVREDRELLSLLVKCAGEIAADLIVTIETLHIESY